MHKLTLKLISFGMMALVATTAIRAIPDVQVIPVVYAASIPSSGISGTFPAGGTWSLTSDGTLTLSGDVDNLAKTIPWKDYLIGIKKITGTDVRLIGNCGSMFANCTNLASFDGTGWDTSKATSMARFFYNCPNLAEAKGIGDWNTSGFTNTAHMFYVEEDTSEEKDHLEYTDEGLKITFRTDADEEGELVTKNIKTETYKTADLDPFTASYDTVAE